MRAALAALPGVRHVSVDFDKKQAVVVAVGSPDHQEFVTALQKAGFGGSVINVQAEREPRERLDQPASNPPARNLSDGQQQPSAAEPSTLSPSSSSEAFAEHVRLSAYLDRDVLHAGQSFRIAVVLDVDDGWHIYGNPLGPGIGKETVITVHSGDGFVFEPVLYAPAHRAEQDFGEAGKTWVWELTGRTVHFVPGEVQSDVSPGMHLLTIGVSGQVCTEGICLPGTITIQLPVTVVASDAPTQPANMELFEGFEQAVAPE